MDLDELVRDSLPVNPPYDGLVAEAYDVWLPPDGRYDDRDLYRDLIREGDGPALELGCGNGRLLRRVPRRRAGRGGRRLVGRHARDLSPSCRARADEPSRCTTPTGRRSQLGREYATLYNPAGSFSLLDDEHDARGGARVPGESHLSPGGRLVVSMWTPEPRARRAGSSSRGFGAYAGARRERPTASPSWSTRRCGLDHAAQIQHTLDRHEVWDADGTLAHHVPASPPAALVDAGPAARRRCGTRGFDDVEIRGSEREFLVFGRAG